MRLSESQIQGGILHEEQLVRDRAARHFAEAYSPDPQPMERAIEAIERYGWDEAFEFSSVWARLGQSENTVRWAIEQLEQPGRANRDTCLRLGSLLAKAPLELVVRHEARIRALKRIPPEDRGHISDRIELSGLDPAELWRRLEAFCEREKDKQYVNEVDLPHAFRLVEALGCCDSAEDRVLDVLAVEIVPAQGDPAVWMEALAVRLAGELRLKRAVPFLARRFHEDADWFREECTEAMAKIGTDEAVEALCEQIPGSEWHVRLFAAGALEKQRAPGVVPRCLELFDRETDLTVANNLMRAVLANFATEGIEPARQQVKAGNLELMEDLLATSLLTGEDFPEQQQWLAEARSDATERRRRRAVLFGKPSAAARNPAPPLPDALDPQPVAPLRSEKGPGRNDPCSCGSGKKYKKCCLNKA